MLSGNPVMLYDENAPLPIENNGAFSSYHLTAMEERDHSLSPLLGTRHFYYALVL